MTTNQAIAEYEEVKRRISLATPVPKNEAPVEKTKRITDLLDNPEKFCKYYFPEYFDTTQGGAELGWFHKKAAREIRDNPNIFLVAEWPREHAKTVFLVTMMTMYLKARKELTGVVITSSSQIKAQMLLSSLQAQLESNNRFTNDYGEQFKFGSWANNEFTTRDDVRFWALGKGQSPRGLLYLNKRPNLWLGDDMDTDEECKNPERVSESVEWITGALLPSFAILGARKIMLGNRIHKNSILANIVGDVNDGDIKNAAITHIKVFATENPKTHQEDQSDDAVPAWKERYNIGVLKRRFSDMGYRMSQREYFHKHIEKGSVFKPEWLVYTKMPKISDFEAIVTYNDPSFKDTKKNDYKAIVAVGKIGSRWYIIDCWVRQATRVAMVQAHYDMNEKYEAEARILKHYIEANFTQDQLRDDYIKEEVNRGYALNIYNDLRKKPEKKGRIENLSVYFERNMIFINEKLKDSFDWQNFKDQLLAFPGGHDDAPDALEGGMWILRTLLATNQPAIMGGTRRKNAF